MVSQWTLTGSTTAYSGTLTTTDGYQIAAAMTWVAITSYTTTFASESVSGAACAIGTCVETLDSAGTRVASTVTDDGNNAICHWFYVLGGATSTAGTASTGTGNWGETKFLTHAQWGTTSGAGVIGSTIKSNGTSVSTSYGHTLSPASVTTFAAGTYSMTWYQPTYASTYSMRGGRGKRGGRSKRGGRGKRGGRRNWLGKGRKGRKGGKKNKGPFNIDEYNKKMAKRIEKMEKKIKKKC